MRQKNGNEFIGNIARVRAVEDCIRATKKYTEGIKTMRLKHPVQGEEFASKVFCKYYEVYPTIELSWDMPAGIAIDWLWGDTPCIDVVFRYDYRINTASVSVRDGSEAVRELARTIPEFSDTLAMAIASGNGKAGKV